MFVSLPWFFLFNHPNKMLRAGSLDLPPFQPRWHPDLGLTSWPQWGTIPTIHPWSMVIWWDEESTSKPASVSQGHSSSASRSLIQWRYFLYKQTTGSALQRKVATQRVHMFHHSCCPRYVSASGIVDLESSGHRCSSRTKAWPNAKRVGERLGQNPKICRNFLGKFRQQKWVKQKKGRFDLLSVYSLTGPKCGCNKKRCWCFLGGKSSQVDVLKKTRKKKPDFLARRVYMQLSRNNVRPVTSNASTHTSGLQEDGSDLLEKPKKKGMKQNAKQKKTTWSVIWWLRLVVWGQSFFKNIQQIRTIGSTKKQLFGCYNSLKTSVFRGWVLANKTNEKHVVGGLRKSTLECWKKKQTKNVARVLLENVSLRKKSWV